MLDYLIALLDDSEIAIERHAIERHVSGSLTNNGGQKFKKQGQNQQKSTKSMPCVYFNGNSCTFNKHHETKGVFYRHICSSCFAQEGKVSIHSASDCKKSLKNEYPWTWLRTLIHSLIMSKKT